MMTRMVLEMMMTFMTCFRGWDIYQTQTGILYYIRLADDLDYVGSFESFEEAIEAIIFIVDTPRVKVGRNVI